MLCPGAFDLIKVCHLSVLISIYVRNREELQRFKSFPQFGKLPFPDSRTNFALITVWISAHRTCSITDIGLLRNFEI